MAKSTNKVAGTKSIDLGTLQDEFVSSRNGLAKAAETSMKAQEAFAHAKTRYEQAETALKEGTKAVLG